MFGVGVSDVRGADGAMILISKSLRIRSKFLGRRGSPHCERGGVDLAASPNRFWASGFAKIDQAFALDLVGTVSKNWYRFMLHAFARQESCRSSPCQACVVAVIPPRGPHCRQYVQ